MEKIIKSVISGYSEETVKLYLDVIQLERASLDARHRVQIREQIKKMISVGDTDED